MLETLRIHQNTDTVDIDQKCLGLTTNIMGPERDNRGLTIQIRHNRHPVAYRKANEISRLISASPELYACLKSLSLNFPQLGTDEPINGSDLVAWFSEQWPYFEDALIKAEGLTKRTYTIKVKALIPLKLMDPDDKKSKPWGLYEIEEYTEKRALDEFHSTVAIACLDDFKITIKEKRR